MKNEIFEKLEELEKLFPERSASFLKIQLVKMTIKTAEEVAELLRTQYFEEAFKKMEEFSDKQIKIISQIARIEASVKFPKGGIHLNYDRSVNALQEEFIIPKRKK